MVKSAEVYPEKAEGDVDDLFKIFIKIMKEKDGNKDEGPPEDFNTEDLSPEELEALKDIREDVWEEKGVLTGEVIKF